MELGSINKIDYNSSKKDLSRIMQKAEKALNLKTKNAADTMQNIKANLAPFQNFQAHQAVSKRAALKLISFKAHKTPEISAEFIKSPENYLTDSEFAQLKKYMLEQAEYDLKFFGDFYAEIYKEAELQIADITPRMLLNDANQTMQKTDGPPVTLRQIFQKYSRLHECFEKIKSLPHYQKIKAEKFGITIHNAETALKLFADEKACEDDELFETAGMVIKNAQSPKNAEAADRVISSMIKNGMPEPFELASLLLYNDKENIPEAAEKSLKLLIKNNRLKNKDILELIMPDSRSLLSSAAPDIKQLRKILENSSLQYIFENININLKNSGILIPNCRKSSWASYGNEKEIRLHDICTFNDDEISKLGRIINNSKIQERLKTGVMSANTLLELAQAADEAFENLDFFIEKTDNFCLKQIKNEPFRQNFYEEAFPVLFSVLSKCSEETALQFIKISSHDSTKIKILSSISEEILKRPQLIAAMSEGFFNPYERINGLEAVSEIENPELQNQFFEEAEKNLFILETYSLVKNITGSIDIIKRTAEKLKAGISPLYADILTAIYKYINSDLTALSAQERLDLHSSINQLKQMPEIKNSEIFTEKELDEINKFSQAVLKSLSRTITPQPVTRQDIKNMMTGFFANNNPELEKLISSFDFSQFGKTGIPLSYPRKEFLSDLTKILKNIPENQQEYIFKKLEITPVKAANGFITGYNGIINLQKLIPEGIEGRVLSAAKKFIKENSADTGDKKLDKALNSLMHGMPEFINIIGKQQHDTHELSLDAHILKVLQEAMKSSEYKDLSNIDKTCLKFAAVMHDIAKADGVKDNEHPYNSALYARNIMEKYPFSSAVKDRIYELIKNHHWLAEYSESGDPERIAALFRHTNDFAAAKIMAYADLKGVGESFFAQHSSALSSENLNPVQDALDKINSSGQLAFTSKIIRKDLIPIVEYQGKKYQVINFAGMNENEDLSQYGFAPGAAKKNARFFVHMNDKKENLETVYLLSDIANGGFLCASYISPENSETYMGCEYGLSLECSNSNIANASSENQSSGGHKDFERFINIITGRDKAGIYRKELPQALKKALKLTDAEYSKLYQLISPKEYITQISEDLTYKIGGRIISGREIKQAAMDAADSLILGMQNEFNLYNPKINAFIAKKDSLAEIPQEFLDFIQEHNLPVYLLGSKKEEEYIF